MRGEVLHYDEAQGFGFIAGADSNRYTFRREDLRRPISLSRGAAVELSESGVQARDVFSPATDAAPGLSPAAGELPVPAYGTAPAPSANRHFGRNAVGDDASGQDQASTGLWGYFWAGITTNYANFRTRARRKEYWGYVLFLFLAFILLFAGGVAIDFALGNLEFGDEVPFATIGISGIVILASVIPSIAMAVRRQHDIGLSGWFFLLIFVPYVGNLIMLVFALIPSQRHENRWGPVPAGVDAR